MWPDPVPDGLAPGEIAARDRAAISRMPARGATVGAYFFTSGAWWNFFIHASCTIIMTWLTDQ